MLPLKLLEWVDKSKLSWHYLAINPNAISILKDNQYLFDLSLLSINKNAIELIKDKPDKINW